MLHNHFSSNLQFRRKQLRLSQENVAKSLFVSRQTISNWELDRTEPSLDDLLAISSLLKIPVDALVRNDLNQLSKKRYY